MCGDVGNNRDASRFFLKYRKERVIAITHPSLPAPVSARRTDSLRGFPRERFGW